jgi:hypothetical protein
MGHLLFTCLATKYVWSVVQIRSGQDIDLEILHTTFGGYLNISLGTMKSLV